MKWRKINKNLVRYDGMIDILSKNSRFKTKIITLESNQTKPSYQQSKIVRKTFQIDSNHQYLSCIFVCSGGMLVWWWCSDDPNFSHLLHASDSTRLTHHQPLPPPQRLVVSFLSSGSSIWLLCNVVELESRSRIKPRWEEAAELSECLFRLLFLLCVSYILITCMHGLHRMQHRTTQITTDLAFWNVWMACGSAVYRVSRVRQ